MCLKSRKHMANNITLGVVRLYVATAHINAVTMGPYILFPIIQRFRKPPYAVLPDGEEEFSDDEGEGWKDR